MVKVPPEFQPRQRRPYPPNNTPSFEEYFFLTYDERLVNSDREYLPILWTSFYCNSGHKKAVVPLKRLQAFLNKLDKKKKYFTIVQYDDKFLNNVDHLDLKVFGLGCKGDYQLPLICQPQPYFYRSRRDIFACFVGKRTHKIREKMFSLNGEGYLISENMTIQDYCKTLSRSVFSLCPRGYGATSFRIAESLQYGAIPVYISDEYLIPHGFNFERYGLLLRPEDNVDEVLRSVPQSRIEVMQFEGRRFYRDYMGFAANRRIVYENI